MNNFERQKIYVVAEEFCLDGEEEVNVRGAFASKDDAMQFVEELKQSSKFNEYVHDEEYVCRSDENGFLYYKDWDYTEHHYSVKCQSVYLDPLHTQDGEQGEIAQ